MIAKVQRTPQGLAILLTAEMVQKLSLLEGAEVHILPASSGTAARHADVGEALAAFERTLPLHENAYRELAK